MFTWLSTYREHLFSCDITFLRVISWSSKFHLSKWNKCQWGVISQEELMRRGQRMCSRRSLWQQLHCIQGTSFTNAHSPSRQFAQIWCTSQRQSYLPRGLVRSVRFYSQDEIRSVDREDKEHVLSPAADLQPDETALKKRQRKSPFFDHLRCCGSPSDVLDLTTRYAPTVRQVSSCLTQMWTITKKMSEEQQRYEQQLMFDHPAFERLLQDAVRSVPHMRNEDTAYSLLAMVNLGVPQRSRVVQTYLRSCQERLNDFNETGLSVLASCLALMEDTPNVAALKKGMRLLVEARLPNIKNVVSLQTMMRALGKDIPLDLKRKLEGKALSMTDQFSLPNSQYMISTMATMRFYSKPLLDICSKRIQEDLSGIPFSRLLKVLHSCKDLHYRRLDLLNDISDYVASMVDIWSNKQVLILLSALESLTFCPSTLMKAFAEKVVADPDALTLKDILCVLKVYSSFSYDLKQQRPEFLDSLSQALDSYLTKMSGFELLKTVYHLSVLGHFPSAPLQQLLQSSTLEQLKTTAPRFLSNQERMFKTVDLCLRLDRPPLPGPLAIPPSLLGDPDTSSLLSKPWLSHSLRGMLEEQAGTTLQEMVLVENLHLIDAVITKPQPSQNSEENAEDARPPPESSQRIAVIFSPHPFCYGTSDLRGHSALKARHLRILGYDPVLVFDQKLHSMSEEDRMDFLRTQIFPEHRRPDAQSNTEQPES